LPNRWPPFTAAAPPSTSAALRKRRRPRSEEEIATPLAHTTAQNACHHHKHTLCDGSRFHILSLSSFFTFCRRTIYSFCLPHFFFRRLFQSPLFMSRLCFCARKIFCASPTGDDAIPAVGIIYFACVSLSDACPSSACLRSMRYNLNSIYLRYHRARTATVVFTDARTSEKVDETGDDAHSMRLTALSVFIWRRTMTAPMTLRRTKHCRRSFGGGRRRRCC
jgi:hypothetical protein